MAVIALLAGCDDSADDPAAAPGSSEPASSTGTASGTTPSATTSTDPGPVVECPHDIVLDPDPSLADAVPEGATSVRLCPAAPGEVTPPRDALTTGVDAVVRAVNGQRTTTRGCADRQLPTYQLAFGYPDGSSFVVTGRFTGCAELLVGSARRAKAGPPLGAFVTQLLAQRDDTTPPADVSAADLDCAQPATDLTYPLGEPSGLAVAVLCVGDADAPRKARRVVLPEHDLAALVRTMPRHTTAADDVFTCSSTYHRVGYWIVGATAWGDPVTMSRGCRGLSYGPDRLWLPDRQARTILQRLTSRAR